VPRASVSVRSMMQVSVESIGDLERRMSVAVPEDQVEQAVESRLKNLMQSVRIKGFRPGKVPYSVVKRQYGGQVRREVLGELVQRSFYEAVQQEKLRPAGAPSIETRPAEGGSGLEFTATFEVYPELELAPLTEVSVERPATEIAEADIDAMVETIRKQHRGWEAVERPAQDGDRVRVNFTGTIGGEPFDGNEGKDVPIELGSGRLIEGFEAGLVGAQAGTELTLDLTFPEDYHVKAVAGKPVQFAVSVLSVEQAKLPEVDEEFARKLGVESGSVEAFRDEVKGNMQRELDEAIKGKVKQQVMDQLLALNPISVPKALVDEESMNMVRQMSSAGQGGGRQLDPGMFRGQAERRVKLGLILADVVKSANLSVGPERLRQAVEAIAAPYEHPEEVVKWYYSDQHRLSEVESLVLEEQVVEWILSQAKIAETPTSFQELIYPEKQS